MSDDKIEVVRGSGNVFRDLGLPNPDIELIKANLAAEIIGILDDRGLTVRAAADIVGIAAADISRIRHADLDRFTIDRLVNVVNKLDRRVSLTITDEHDAA